jgi:hypothetical protein
VSPGPQHGTPAGDAFLAIQKLARGSGGDVQELLTLYALEGPLTRVAASRYREDFVLKGGVLLRCVRPAQADERHRSASNRNPQRRW